MAKSFMMLNFQCDAIPYLFRYCDMIECVPDHDFNGSGRSTEFVECSGKKPAFAINSVVWQRQRVNNFLVNNALSSKTGEGRKFFYFIYICIIYFYTKRFLHLSSSSALAFASPFICSSSRSTSFINILIFWNCVILRLFTLTSLKISSMALRLAFFGRSWIRWVFDSSSYLTSASWSQTFKSLIWLKKRRIDCLNLFLIYSSSKRHIPSEPFSRPLMFLGVFFLKNITKNYFIDQLPSIFCRECHSSKNTFDFPYSIGSKIGLWISSSSFASMTSSCLGTSLGCSGNVSSSLSLVKASAILSITFLPVDRADSRS